VDGAILCMGESGGGIFHSWIVEEVAIIFVMLFVIVGYRLLKNGSTGGRFIFGPSFNLLEIMEHDGIEAGSGEEA